MPSIIFDLETTGLIVPGAPADKQPKITEIGAILVGNGKIVDELSIIVNPECEIPQKIQKLTGITQAMVDAEKPLVDVIDGVVKFFGSASSVWGHNVGYDIDVMNFNMELLAMSRFPFPPKVFDTISEYNHLFGYRMKLGDLYKRVVGEEMPKAHRAVEDCRGIYKILEKDGALCLL